MTTDDARRFRLVNEPDRVGILDTKKNLFAPFLESKYGTAASRAMRTTAALNRGDETTTGFTWEKQ